MAISLRALSALCALAILPMYGMDTKKQKKNNANKLTTITQQPADNSYATTISYLDDNNSNLIHRLEDLSLDLQEESSKTTELSKKNFSEPPIGQKPWLTTRFFSAILGSNDKDRALNLAKSLKQKPAGPEKTDKQHQIDWGVEFLIAEGTRERSTLEAYPAYLPFAKTDKLQDVIRKNHTRTEDLDTLITTSKKFDMQVDEDLLEKSYSHLKIEDDKDLLCLALLQLETQKRLQKRKGLRKLIHEIKYKKNLGDISDDEYGNESMAEHILKYVEDNQ